jgi:hypothetical protein
LNRKKVFAERHLQLVVLGNQPIPASRDSEFTQLLEIDPANPRWHETLVKLPQFQQLSLAKSKKPLLTKLGKGPLGNGSMTPYRHELGELVQLKPNAESPDVSWEAYSLPITQPGRPHILEVDYPSNVPQTLGISILEPNAAGMLSPIGLDSGVDTTESVMTNTPPRWLRHRLIFWPRTNAPMVLMTNGRDRSPAMYGKIRVLTGGERLSRWTPSQDRTGQRLLAAYIDRPVFPANFSANQSLDAWSNRSLDDWSTFYEGGSRLIEYLRHQGYNGLMLAVLADGSSIYPSATFEPTPRYDTGMFFTSGQDPVRKDVAEMLFRMFDREEMQLVPTLEFASPLPELEAVRRMGGEEARSIEWIGADGMNWTSAWPTQRGLAPYYNVLHPRVQEAMLKVFQELVHRYAQHPSFAGVAVRLSADGYAQLPGPDWGLDDETMAHFGRDTQIQVPGAGPQRFAARAAFLAQEPARRVWLDWRAAQLGAFYHRMAETLVSVRPRSKLYLAGVGMIGGTELEMELRPTLSQHLTLSEALLRIGFDAKHYHDERDHIVFLRPERMGSQENLGTRAIDLQVRQMLDIDRYFQGFSTPGSLFFHQPHEVHMESFDQKCPYKAVCPWLMAQSTPSGEQNRKRFIHSLATLDSQVMVDGGWLLSMGQEDAIHDLMATYRSLPATTFRVVNVEHDAESSQPVTFRFGTQGGRTYLYAVNDAPFATTARIHVEAGASCRIVEITGARKIAPLQADAGSGMYWEVQLEPYDLVGVQFSEPNVRLSEPHVTWSSAVDAALNTQISRLGARAAALRNPPPMDALPNLGFESSQQTDTPIPEWTIANQNGSTVQIDTTQKHSGVQSVKMTSMGGKACLVSRTFSAPATGRLAILVWLRVANASQQPPLMMALEANLHGREFDRYASIGLSSNPDQPAKPIMPEWTPFVLQIDDLPLEGLSALRVRFDLMGPGEVWIDDVQVYDLVFSEPELRELGKMIYLTGALLQKGQIGDCLNQLEGYWPRFLEEYVPLQVTPAPRGSTPDSLANKPRPPEEKPPERTGLMNRIKDMVPESLRF